MHKTFFSDTVKKNYKQGESHVEVLKGISARFEQGISYAVTGPSGSGKSTFLHVLAGLDACDAGAIYFNNKNIATFTAQEKTHFLNKEIGLVFQLPYLIDELNVLENIMTKNLVEGTTSNSIEQAKNILKKIGLENFGNRHPSSLSGGEQQRVAIARAIFNKPSFLLADEPTGNLDVSTGASIVELLQVCKSEGMGLIISTHDAYVAQSMDKILLLSNGILQEKV